MTKSNPARRRFLAALALYLGWVGALAAMAVTSSYRPPNRHSIPAAEAPAENPENP